MTQKTLVIVATLLLVGVLLGVAVYAVVSLNKAVSQVAVALEKLQLGGLTNYDELALTGASLKYEKIELVAGDDDQAYTNLSDHTEFVKYGSWMTSGRASSSFDVALFASSSASVPLQHDYTDLVLTTTQASSTRVIGLVTLGTSTQATTTNSEWSRLVGNAGNDRLVAIPKGWSVLFTIQKGDFSCTSVDGAPSSSGCEFATSSNRGFNLTALLEIYSTSTSR